MAETDVFRLPDLGEGLTDAEIVTWHVSAGDRVVAGQPLVAVETDKAVVDIPSPQSGTIARLHGAIGDRLPVGAPLVTFGTTPTAAVGVVGRLEEATVAAAPQASASVPGTTLGPRRAAGLAIRAAPAIRQLARELGVDLATVVGTGPEGTISSDDVRDAASGVHGMPVRGARRAMAERMADAHARVVHATVTGEADIHAWPAGSRPLPRLIRAVAVAAHAVPRLNAAFDDARWELRDNPTVDLGIAMETDDGLFVPVLRDVGSRGADAIAAEVADLEVAVRARTIAPERLRGQTISLSNFGAVAGRYATMIVVPPQVAIVGAGRAAPRVVADGQHAVVHRVLPLSLTIDHRVITGVEACRFLSVLVADLELSR